LKRKADEENFAEQGGKRIKKLKTDAVDEEMDIIVAGISSVPDIPLPGEGESVAEAEAPEEPDSGKDFINVILQLWGSDLCSEPVITLKDAEIFFHSKLLDALKIYLVSFNSCCNLDIVWKHEFLSVFRACNFHIQKMDSFILE